MKSRLELQRVLDSSSDLQRELRLAHEDLIRDRQEELKDKRPSSHSSSPSSKIEGQRHLRQQSARRDVARTHRSETKPNMVSLNANPNKVLVTIYMESLCPACRKYTTTYLKQVLEAPGVGKIIDLRVVPFGNAHATDAENADIKYNSTAQLQTLLKQMESPWNDPVCIVTAVLLPEYFSRTHIPDVIEAEPFSEGEI